MIKLIVKKELKEIVRSSNIGYLFVGMLVLLALAFYNGHSYYSSRQQVLAASQETTYQQFVNQGDKNPHLGAHFGFYAFKPAADMGMVDNGLEPFTGNSFYLEPHKRGIVKYKEVSDSTALRSFGFLNISFFIQFLLPLFIFLVSHNSFSKEWENGTIKLLLNANVSKRQLVLGKLTAFLLVSFSFLLLSAIAVLGLFLLDVPAEQMGKMLRHFMVYLIGASFFVLVTTLIVCAVSLLTKSSVLSLVYLAGFWLLGLFLVPRLSGEVSKKLYPPLSSIEFEDMTYREKTYGVGNEGHRDHRRALLRDSVMKAYQVTHIEELPVYFIPISIEHFEESDGVVMDRWYNKIEHNDEKQKDIVTYSSLLSPFMAFRDFSMHISSSDMDTHHHFADKAEKHRRAIGALVDDFYENNAVANKEFWQTVPRFQYEFPDIGYRVKKSMFSIVVLLGWLLFAVLLFGYAARTPIRLLSILLRKALGYFSGNGL